MMRGCRKMGAGPGTDCPAAPTEGYSPVPVPIRLRPLSPRTAPRPIRAACRALVLLLLPVAAMASDPVPQTAPDGADPFAANACVQCHRDRPGRLSEIVEVEWKQSVHYAASVACDGCHGGDPTARREQFDSDEAYKRAAHRERNPEFLVLHRPDREFVSTVRGRSVSYFCGKCHDEIKEKHLGSPHGDFGDPTCLYCHGGGSHLIDQPTPGIIDTRARAAGGRCSQCHAASTMEAVKRIRDVLVETERRIESSGAAYQQLETWGYRNLQLEELHHHVREVHSRLRRIFHSFNMRDITNYATEIQDVADRTETTHEMVQRLRQAQRRQTVVGLIAVAVLLGFAGLLVYYKHAFLEEDHRD